MSTGHALASGGSYESSRNSTSRTVSFYRPKAERLKTEDCDLVSHGTRSISRLGLTEEMERSDLRSIDQTFELTGKKILGAFPRPPITDNSQSAHGGGGPALRFGHHPRRSSLFRRRFGPTDACSPLCRGHQRCALLVLEGEEPGGS